MYVDPFIHILCDMCVAIVTYDIVRLHYNFYNCYQLGMGGAYMQKARLSQ